MSKLEVEFAFEIGDIVYFRSALHNRAHHPQKYLVVARFAEECPGGIQLHYKLDCHRDSVLEIALTKEKPPVDDEFSGNYWRAFRKFGEERRSSDEREGEG